VPPLVFINHHKPPSTKHRARPSPGPPVRGRCLCPLYRPVPSAPRAPPHCRRRRRLRCSWLTRSRPRRPVPSPSPGAPVRGPCLGPPCAAGAFCPSCLASPPSSLTPWLAPRSRPRPSSPIRLECPPDWPLPWNTCAAPLTVNAVVAHAVVGSRLIPRLTPPTCPPKRPSGRATVRGSQRSSRRAI
jgi:hypothetical protein